MGACPDRNKVEEDCICDTREAGPFGELMLHRSNSTSEVPMFALIALYFEWRRMKEEVALASVAEPEVSVEEQIELPLAA